MYRDISVRAVRCLSPLPLFIKSPDKVYLAGNGEKPLSVGSQQATTLQDDRTMEKFDLSIRRGQKEKSKESCAGEFIA